MEPLEVKPVILTGKRVRLEPLSEAHLEDLTLAGKDESIWRWMQYGTVTTREKMLGWIQNILSRQASGTDVPFAVIYLETGKAIGATRYMEIRPKDRGVEIGGTWYQVEYQRTGINAEAKYLLLRHAFETLGCIRVQFKTDMLNERSKQALERLGVVKEGVFRHHIILPDGRFRDSVYYSILDTEWPQVKAQIEVLMNPS